MSLTDQGQASQGDRVKADRKESTSFFEEKKSKKTLLLGALGRGFPVIASD
jgi:hypothetical protein